MNTHKIIFILLLLTATMQAQDYKQPKQGKPPVVNVKKPQTFTLSNGLKVMVVEDHKLPRVTFNLTIDNPPFAEKDKKGVDFLTSSLMGNGSVKISKDDFNEELDFLGANVSFSSNGAYANSLSKYSRRVLELMSFGTLFPNFTEDELNKEKAKMLESLKSQEKSAPAIASRVVDVLTFGKNHPMGEYVTQESIANVNIVDIQKYYDAHFVPENAYLVIIGDVKYKDVKKSVETLFGKWKKKNTPKESYPDPANASSLEINFVDVPNASQSEISLVNTVHLKMNAPDFFPAVIATHVLGGGYNSNLNMNLREAHGWTYGANSSIGVGKYIDKLKSSSSVRVNATDSAVVEFVKEIKKMRVEKVTDELLNDVKAGFIGRFVMNFEKPQSIARYALNTEIEELPADFYENYIKAITAVTADDVLKAANKYFLIENTRIFIAAKGEEVIPGLEKLNIPINYFDKYGNPVEKPKYK
ncbi:M16 family metallopeptidase [Flavobacterium algicola]|uniref:M16 family metallopeptidase n=1 Tax=Flavobacterium algicola TaxID=556529 RepID=UPI001EFC6E97|nr:pitrilysin family protein [Flavobacterium algicola]MCG9791532.1 insulinase family protein [Flavobacterium algicola]